VPGSGNAGSALKSGATTGRHPERKPCALRRESATVTAPRGVRMRERELRVRARSMNAAASTVITS
jgi:hypothetical protein